MLKMYNAEVLSKFPVVQHFPFGSLFAWERDPFAKEIQASVHTSSQPKSSAPTARPQPALRDPMAEPAGTAAPWANKGGLGGGASTAAPWASSRVPTQSQGPAVPAGPNQPTRAPWASSTPLPPPGGRTGAPWARPGVGGSAAARGVEQVTKAPWAGKKEEGSS